MRIAFFVFVTMATSIAAGPEEWDRELGPAVRLTGDEALHVPARVVDAITRRPIADARVRTCFEPSFPHAEPWREGFTGETDRDGLVLLPVDDPAPWTFVSAPGYAPLGEMRAFGEFRLRPGRDFPLEVRDWRDRPVPGAIVEVLVGCGHTPAVRTVVTGPDGRVVLPCIDPGEVTLWLRADGLAGCNPAYDGMLATLPVERGIAVLHARPGPAVEGCVLTADGKPAAGAVVGSYDKHRGPWTKAGPDGRFRLLGVKPYDGLVAYAGPPDTFPDGVDVPRADFVAVPGVAHRVRLSTEDPAPDAPLVVRVKTGAPLGPEESVRVVFIRDGGGYADVGHVELVDDTGEETFEVPPGAYRVIAGEPGGRLRPAEGRARVGPKGGRVELSLAPNPVWKPRIEGGAGDGDYSIVTDDGVLDATRSNADPGAIHVPAAGPFAVVYREDDGRTARAVFDGPPAGEVPPLVLPAAPPEPPGTTAPEIGRFPKARLTMRRPDGRPAAGAELTIRGSLSSNVHYTSHATLDADGARELEPRPGARVEIEAKNEAGLVTFATRIDGPGPWRFAWPDTSIEVRAVDGDGAAVPEFAVICGDDVFRAEAGVARLVGAPVGPVRFFVEAEGRRPHDVRLVLADGARREIVVRMNPR